MTNEGMNMMEEAMEASKRKLSRFPIRIFISIILFSGLIKMSSTAIERPVYLLMIIGIAVVIGMIAYFDVSRKQRILTCIITELNDGAESIIVQLFDPFNKQPIPVTIEKKCLTILKGYKRDKPFFPSALFRSKPLVYRVGLTGSDNPLYLLPEFMSDTGNGLRVLLNQYR